MTSVDTLLCEYAVIPGAENMQGMGSLAIKMPQER